MSLKRKHIIILGSPAVGKLTTAKILSKKLKYVLFDNSKAVDVASLLYKYGTQEYKTYRDEIRHSFFQRAISNQNINGLISTNVLKRKENWNYFLKLKSTFISNGWEVYFVILVAEKEILLKRVENISRKNKMAFNNAKKLDEWLKSNPDHSKPINSSVTIIDNSNIQEDEVANQITKLLYAQ